MISKALLLSGQPESALHSANRCLAVCSANALADFDLAYAQEARARALRALGDTAEAAAAWTAATSVPIADPEDRRILEADFADY
jgi:tetratricopeptide (TPR) repeat protein